PGWPSDVRAISALDDLAQDSLVFIKNSKFMQRFLPKIAQAAELKVGVVIDDKYFAALDPATKGSLEALPWLATTSNLAMSLAHLSRPFYEAKMKGLNTQVDGRQMGTV